MKERFLKLLLVSVASVSILISSTLTPQASTGLTDSTVNSDSETIKSAQSFREIYGLEFSEDHVRNILTSQIISTDLEEFIGFPLTDQEKLIVNERNHDMDESVSVRIMAEQKFGENFGGSYFDSTTGVTTILLSASDQKVSAQDELSKLFPGHKIDFKQVGLSYNEMKELQKKIVANYSKINYSSVSIREKENIIVVTRGDNFNVEALYEIIDPKFVRIEDGEISNYFGLELGERIKPTIRNTLVGNCSSGFFAEINNTNVLVTAGHCNKLGTFQSWYTEDNDSVGSFYTKVSGSTTFTDSSSIDLSSSVDRESIVDNYYLTDVYEGSYQVGTIRFKKGFSTGVTWGTLVDTSYNYSNDDPDVGTTYAHLVEMDSSPGDSGAIVYRIPDHAELYGTLNGGGHSEDGTHYTIISPIDDVIDGLGIDKIYGDYNDSVIWQ